MKTVEGIKKPLKKSSLYLLLVLIGWTGYWWAAIQMGDWSSTHKVHLVGDISLE